MAISIKDYAASRGVTYEAVRRQMTTYAANLEGHVSNVGKTRFLDDDAVAYLDNKRSKPFVVVAEAQTDVHKDTVESDEIIALKASNEQLRDQLIACQQQIILLQQREMAVNEELTNGRIAMNQVKALTDQNGELTDRTEKLFAENAVLQERAEQLQKEKTVAENEAKSFVKAIFGFYRKK